jgi:hypothetical protein
MVVRKFCERYLAVIEGGESQNVLGCVVGSQVCIGVISWCSDRRYKVG